MAEARAAPALIPWDVRYRGTEPEAGGDATFQPIRAASMTATIYYMRDHYRGRTGQLSRRGTQVRPRPQPRRNVMVLLGILVFVLALISLGVWLTDEVAAVGRANGQCLTSARRACGMFPAEHAWQAAAPSDPLA
jgi:hypothetical protein